MSRIIRNVLIGSAVAMVASAQPASLSSIDVSTAEAVPTTCSAAQMTKIYNDCVSSCEKSLTSTTIECSDVSTRYMLVKCATEADKCGSANGSSVVKAAQVQRLNDVCKTATRVPIADVKLLFAQASEIANSNVAQKQVKDLADAFRRTEVSAENAGNVTALDHNGLRKEGKGMYNGASVPSVVRGDQNSTTYNRQAHTSVYDNAPVVEESLNGRKVEVSASSSESESKRGHPSQKGSEGVREYTWSKSGSNGVEKKGSSGKSEHKGVSGKSDYKGIGSGKAESKGTGSGNGKPEYKGIGSGNGIGKGSASGVASLSVNGTYKNTTAFKSTVKPNSVSKVAPAASVVLAIALSAFFL